MKHIAKIVFMFIGLLAISAPAAGNLTEENVKQLISRVDNAVNELNAKAVADELSNDVVITLHISMQGQQQTAKLSKQEYVSMLEQGWAQFSNYKYSRTKMEIKIAGNKAVVAAEIHESMTMQGQNISGNSKEEVSIALVNGIPLITEVTGYINM